MTNEVLQKTASDEQNVSSSNGKEEQPKLRFNIYGNVWKKDRLDEICTINPTTKKLPEEFYYIDLECVENGKIVSELNLISKNDAPSRAQRLLDANDMLYQTVRPYQKNNFLFTKLNDFPTVASTGYAQIRSSKNNIKYIFQLLHTDNFVVEAMKRSTGTGYPAISSSDLGEIEVYYPSLYEQQKIADFLSLVDQRIEKQRQLVESLKKYKRGLFSYCFQKNKSYKIARLGDFAKIYQPSTISQSQFNDGEYKVFGANGYIGNYDKYNHAVPQVTISCRGEKCGTVNFVDAYTWITGNSMVVNIDDQNEINKRYLYHCLSNQNLKYLVSGSAQPQIIRTDVARHSIPVPSIEFQEKLSFFLDSIEEKIKNEQNMEEYLLDMKNALLQQMFI